MKFFNKTGLVAAAAFTASLFVSVGAASAATCTAMSGPQTVDYELIQSETPLLTDNVVLVECVDNSNDSNTINPTYEIFGMTGWILSDKSDTNGSGPLQWDTVDGFDGPQPGGSTWAVTGLSPLIADVFVTLKQKNSFAAFKLDTAEALEGTWATSDTAGQGFDISHGSIYYKECTDITCDPPVNFDVPVPAGLPLMLAGLGAFGYMRKKQRKSA